MIIQMLIRTKNHLIFPFSETKRICTLPISKVPKYMVPQGGVITSRMYCGYDVIFDQ